MVKAFALFCFLIFWLPACSQAATINMSRDLVSLGIASSNAAPNSPKQDAQPLIQAALYYAASHPGSVLTMDRGDYYLLTPSNPFVILTFWRLTNVTVDLAGSTIFFTGPMIPNGFNITECTNLTLTNFTTRFTHPPYTHARITAVDPIGRSIAYQALPGWPDPATFADIRTSSNEEPALIAAFFRNGTIVPGTTRSTLDRPMTGSTVKLRKDGTPWTQPDALGKLRAGDTLVVTARGGGSPIQVWDSNAVTLSKITVHGSANWAVAFFSTSNSIVDGVRIAPQPGTGLVGSNADGIHFAWGSHDNQIRNSYVSRTMDDALIMDNMHVAMVTKRASARQFTVDRNQRLRFPNGTAVNFLDRHTAMEITGGVITTQSPSDGSPYEGYILASEVELGLDRDVPSLAVGMGMVYADPLLRGAGSTIHDNIVEDTIPGRGVWLSGVRGVTVEGNLFRRTAMASVALVQTTDLGDLGDVGPPSHDVVIRNNAIESALGPSATGTGSQVALGAIEVISTNDEPFAFGLPSANTNITISGNSIVDSARSAVWIGQLSQGAVLDNRIGEINQHPEAWIWAIGNVLPEVVADFARPVVVRDSSGVAVNGTRSTTTTTVVEYYNPTLDHYFITRIPDEIAKLDAGTQIKGWERTGQTVRAFVGPQPGTSPVCRFYIPPALGDSHFFGRGAAECAATAASNPSFVLEDESIMHVLLPTAGVCPPSSTEVYRVFSARTDANHRYLIDPIARDHMVSSKWQPEGDGDRLVVMCAPQEKI